MSDSVTVHLDRPAEHVDVDPGNEIILRGVFHSTYDGSEVDAATTTWPDSAPGGSSVDAGGLIDFTAGGFHFEGPGSEDARGRGGGYGKARSRL